MRLAPLREEDLGAYRPQFLAWADDEAVGWCDVIERPQELLRHSAVLGIGIALMRGFAVEGLCRRHRRARGEYFDSYLMAWLC